MVFFCFQLNGRVSTFCGLSGRSVNTKSLFNTWLFFFDSFSEIFFTFHKKKEFDFVVTVSFAIH